jgi:GNAT superfamily N-acetyltransferase
VSGDPRAPEPIGNSSLAGAADAIAEGFADNEIWAWMVPHEPTLLRGLRRYYRQTLYRIFLPMEASWTTADRMGGIERLMHDHHPHEPHWYLNTLSIHPDRQRQGYGSALIAPGLERADADGLPCYLETQRQSNIPFYARFGFELQEEISLLDSPPLWTMWRPVQA